MQSTSVPLPSNRKFGYLFTAVFALAGAYAAWKGHAESSIALLVVACTFAGLAVAAPAWLGPLNRLWFNVGIALGRVVSPIILGLIFFGVLTPVSILTRLFGRDALHLRKRLVASYWIERSPRGPAPDSFKNQF